MKRSEMLTILEDVLTDNLGFDAWSYIPEYKLKLILDKLEAAGMQPPSRPNDYGALNSQGVVTLINEWDHE